MFNEEYRFGSAKWASGFDVRSQGLFQADGPQIGFWGSQPLFLKGDAPMITIAGARSGKLRDVLGYVMCGYDGRMLINDSKGELAAISFWRQRAMGKHAYAFNPFELHGIPAHRMNPLDILKPGSPSLVSDTRLIMEMLMPGSGSDQNAYFELTGQRLVGGLARFCVVTRGAVSLTSLYELISEIDTPPELTEERNADQVFAEMMCSGDADVVRVAREFHAKRETAPKEWSGILGEVHKAFSFMADPSMRDMLGDEADFSLEVLTDELRASNVYLMIPAEYNSIFSSFLRVTAGVGMLYKARHQASPRVLFVIDEAGQLGRFDQMVRAFTYGAGAGIRTWAIFQDLGQIQKNYGREGVQTLLGSAQLRQFFGVRDYETAVTVSKMLGNETLEYVDTAKAAQAEAKKRAVVEAMFYGDPHEAFFEARDAQLHAATPQKQQRPLMTPDEVMQLPEDRQILFVSGRNLRPIQADKYPYFMRREMAGMYFPNPYHPPLDQVRVQGRFGTSVLKIIRRAASAGEMNWPQHALGYYDTIEGYGP